MTTDGYVVTPLFFPGAISVGSRCTGRSTISRSAGRAPLWISLGMILEEGLAWSTLDAVFDSVRDAARECDVTIVTGDTKVVPRGAADGIFHHDRY
ncbi:MAG: AIR synthase related protein [Planctomycetales bacterium]